MSVFEFEKNIEQDLVECFAENKLESFRTRTLQDLGVDNIQLVFNYTGALDDTRQVINGKHEFNSHEGVLQVFVNTYRQEEETHHQRIGKVRSLLLNHTHGIDSYHVFDIQPTGATHMEFEETNHDQSQLDFSIKFRFTLPTPDE